MRLLMFHLEQFWYRPYLKENQSEKKVKRKMFNESILIWIHAETSDEQNRPNVFRKMVKNIRWMVNKTDCCTIILHSFVHLSESKADLKFAKDLIDDVGSSLTERGLDVYIIPSGLNEFSMHVKGPSLSKVFKAF